METLEESTAIVIVEAAAEVRKRERDIAELVGEAFAREQVISEQRQQIAELAASAAAPTFRPPPDTTPRPPSHRVIKGGVGGRGGSL